MRNYYNTKFNNPDLDLIHSFVMITRSLERTIAIRFIGLSKVTPEQDAVLQMLNVCGRLSIGELSTMLVREHNTIASLIARMERAGLVLKHKDRLNSNRVTIELSPNARESWDSEIIPDIFNKAISVLSETEKEQLRIISEKIFEKTISLSEIYEKERLR